MYRIRRKTPKDRAKEESLMTNPPAFTLTTLGLPNPSLRCYSPITPSSIPILSKTRTPSSLQTAKNHVIRNQNMQINLSSESNALPCTSPFALPTHPHTLHHPTAAFLLTPFCRSRNVDPQIVQMDSILQVGRLRLDKCTCGDVVESSTSPVMSDIAKAERSFPTSFQFLVIAIIKGCMSE